MFGGVQSGRVTCEDYWKQLTITFKYLLISTLVLAIFGLFTSKIVYFLANFIPATVNTFQLWRLLTSFLANPSLISLLFDLLILATLLPPLETRYSTPYLIIEIIIQNLYCNVAFVLLGESFSLLGLVDSTSLLTYGLTNVMLIFIWQRVSLNPQEMTRLWCLPCIMPMAYLPWCFMILLLLQGRIDTVIGCGLGYYQHMILKRSFFPLSLKLYLKIESWLPNIMKEQQGFITVKAVQSNLHEISVGPNYSRANTAADSNELMSEVVSGGGVAIGGRQMEGSGSYRQHWLEQEDQHQQQLGDESSRTLSLVSEENSHALNGIGSHNVASNDLL